MTIDFKLWKVAIKCFRGIKELELEFVDGVPSVLIGSNNAGKSTVLNAIALALGGGGFHQWHPSENDFYCDQDGNRSRNFRVQVFFRSEHELGYPAVRGVGQPAVIHGVQVKGKTSKANSFSHSRTLFDENGRQVTISTRTQMKAGDKEKYSEHDVGYRVVNARIDDIRDHMPEVWLFRPQNIEASLYIWKTGPISKLSRHLAEQFLNEEWTLSRPEGDRRMPDTLHRAYRFFQEAVDAFPVWKDEMKPRLERVFSRYVGAQASIDLKPDVQALTDWLAQKLSISLATDPENAATPLRNMGDGWQSAIRLAALEALSEYPELVKDRVVLLIEEPETHLHPHLCRKIKNVLSDLAQKAWTVVYTTHSSELTSFANRQNISRLTRTKGAVTKKTIDTSEIDDSAKLQSKLDERGAHDFLFSTGAIFCEGKDDAFATRLGFEKSCIDFDARSISVTQCGSVTAIPAFCAISHQLGIRWCALTDEDIQEDGTIKPNTSRAREQIESYRSTNDLQICWPRNLEDTLGVTIGKATPETTSAKLADENWKSNLPNFSNAINKMARWIDPNLTP